MRPEGILTLIVTIALYALPYIVACLRHKRNANAILVVNLLLGWTGIGWIVALAWAISVDAPATSDHP